MISASCKICQSPLRSEIESRDSTLDADQTIEWARSNGLRLSRAILARHRHGHKNENAGESKILADKSRAKTSPRADLVAQDKVDDLTFLDSVTERAYKRLVAGEYDLKIESAFKAIEIKYKISEVSSNEKLLLEILSEIRAEELNKSPRRAPQLSETA